MANQELSRFDYLFEPIEGDLKTAEGGYGQLTDTGAQAARRPRSARVVLAFVVLGVGLAVILLWPQPAGAGQVRPSVTTPAKTAAATPPATASSPVLESPSQGPEIPEPTPQAVTTAAPAPQPSTPPAAKPRQAPAPTPTVRVPMSVSPQPRRPFPNQHPSDGSDGRGGLLGLGGLL